jgi:hypothetical protein
VHHYGVTLLDPTRVLCQSAMLPGCSLRSSRSALKYREFARALGRCGAATRSRDLAPGSSGEAIAPIASLQRLNRRHRRIGRLPRSLVKPKVPAPRSWLPPWILKRGAEPACVESGGVACLEDRRWRLRPIEQSRAVLLNIGKCLMPKFLFRRGRFHGSHWADVRAFLSTGCHRGLAANFIRLIAALRSRSWMTPHSSHTHSRSERVNPAWTCPQSDHVLLDGNQRSANHDRRASHGRLVG